jgi:hypothetical protein
MKQSKIKRAYNRVKLEAFYVRRLLQEGYGPSYWLPYIKHRFFGKFQIRNMSRIEYEADPDLELHTICNKQGVWMLFWMLRSFLMTSKLRPSIIINDDGSMDESDEKFLKSKFSNIKIYFYDEMSEFTANSPVIPDIVKKATATGVFFMRRLISVLARSKAKKVIVTDIDIFFYKPPTEIMDFVAGIAGCDALVHRQPGDEIIFDMMVTDTYSQKHQLKEKKIALMNGGYIIIDRDKMSFEQLAEYLHNAKRPFNDYFVEMVAWACLLAQMNFKFLPPDRYAMKGRLNDTMIFKHYTSTRRYELYAYGIDELERKISQY